MTRILLVGAGGFVGSVLRYLLGGVVQSGGGAFTFPVGTLAVNVLGCLGVGVLAQLVEVRGAFTPDVRALLIVGFLGGFTTFSAFANETLSGIREGAYATAIANVLANLTLCLIAVWLGRLLAQAIWK